MSSLSLSLNAMRGALQLDVELELHFEVEGDGGPVALVGPNGAGKTSVLRWIAGDSFAVHAAKLEVGAEVWVDSERGIHLPPERREVAYVPQGDALFTPLSVRDNVAFPLRARGATAAEARAAADKTLSEWGLAGLAHRMPAKISGGERQKVALARAMVAPPRVLLLDEPTAALDPGARRAMRERIERAAAGRPTLIVTHDVRDVRSLCTLVVVLEAGRVVQQGRPDALARDPATPFVRELFEPLNP